MGTDTGINNFAVFIGQSRPYLPVDTAKILLTFLERSPLSITAVFFYSGDPLYNWAKERFPAYRLPRLLHGPYGQIKKELESIEPPPNFQRWLIWLKSMNIDSGLVFYAGWIPKQVFSIFPEGLVNYHPGPLPELPGYEPETMAVLLGIDHYYGTLHRVDEKFDNGEILWYSPAIKIKPKDGPVSVLYKTTLKAVKELPKVLVLLYSNTLKLPERTERSVVVYASKKACRTFSVIDWQRDGLITIMRKNRAFNEQEISLDLIAHYGGALHVIEEVFPANTWYVRPWIRYSRDYYKALPGMRIGIYRGPGRLHGSPVVKTLTLPVILKLKPQSENPLSKEKKTPPRKIRKHPVQLVKDL